MRKLLTIGFLLLMSGAIAQNYTYEELLDEIDEDAPMRVRNDQGVVHEIDLAQRSIIIGGYSYLVGPAYGEAPVEVSLYGTEAGSFELLKEGMKVEVIYADFGLARAAFVINELAKDADVEH